MNSNQDNRDIDYEDSGMTPHRIVQLSDGIFSIVMTILILEIRIPHPPNAAAEANLASELLSLGPKIESYIYAFLTLGIFWVAHHYHFHYIKRSDRKLLWINVAFLMSITFIPLSTNLMGEFPHNRLSTIIYAINIFISGTLMYFNWRYATTNCRLVDCHLDREMINYISKKNAIAILIFIIAIITSFFNFRVGFLLYMVLPFLHWHYKRKKTTILKED